MEKNKNITNPVVTEYLNGFYEPVNDELGEFRAEAEAKRVPIILRDTEAMLLSLMRIKMPGNILEIGTALGYSACCFATVYDGCRVVTVESDANAYEKAVKNIGKLGLSDRIKAVKGRAQDVLPGLEEGSFDMVFIDAAKSHYKVFWDEAVKLCNPGALLVSDNILLKGGTASDEFDTTGKFKTSIRRMREYLEYLYSLDYADTTVFSIGDGLAVSVLKR